MSKAVREETAFIYMWDTYTSLFSTSLSWLCWYANPLELALWQDFFRISVLVTWIFQLSSQRIHLYILGSLYSLDLRYIFLCYSELLVPFHSTSRMFVLVNVQITKLCLMVPVTLPCLWHTASPWVSMSVDGGWLLQINLEAVIFSGQQLPKGSHHIKKKSYTSKLFVIQIKGWACSGIS